VTVEVVQQVMDEAVGLAVAHMSQEAQQEYFGQLRAVASTNGNSHGLRVVVDR